MQISVISLKIQFSMSTQFNCQAIPFIQTVLIQTILFNISIVCFFFTHGLNVKTALYCVLISEHK